MKAILKLTTSLLIFLSIISCNQANKESEKKVSRFIGDTLFLPEISEVLYKDSLYKETIAATNKKAGLKISTLLWGDCHSCIEDLKNWGDFYQYVENKNEVEILFYLYTSDLEFFRKNLYNKEIHKYPLILDEKLRYVDENKLPFKNKTYQTFLLNSDNEVILVGNPIYNDELMELYREEIKKRIN